MKNEVIILGARPYDFTDERTGKQITGVSCHVLPLTNVDPLNTSGLIPVKYSLTPEQFAEIAQTPLPARAKMHMTVNIATKKVSFEKFSDVAVLDLAG
ncbi:hypothetical protein [Streptococcus marmotae]|uniref:hypothetical protein n=1 Tax=Streptococcus marmotae TaxID=1825069 RepID=UPI000831826B|nr:hypothetical protein [Streptococcus marmotae]